MLYDSLFALDMKLELANIHVLHLDPLNVRWFKPPLGYLKLNVESVRDGNATYGGLFRNDDG